MLWSGLVLAVGIPGSHLKMPVVSVVIPVFSRAAAVVRAIESVTTQSYADYEIIVVDDASTDDTAERVAALGIGKLRLLRHETNRGAAAARNTGVKAARGRWVAFLDSDDEWTNNDKLALQLAALGSAGPRVRGCATGYVLSRNEYRSDVRLGWTPRRLSRSNPFRMHHLARIDADGRAHGI